MENPKRIRYGIDVSKANMALPYVDLPQFIFDKLVEREAIVLPKSKRQANRDILSITDAPDGRQRVCVMTRRAGRLENGFRQSALKQLIAFFDFVDAASAYDAADPLVSIEVSPHKLGISNRYSIDAVALWPSSGLPQAIHQRIVTTAMRNVAQDVGYLQSPRYSKEGYRQLLSEDVFAIIRRDQGVVLETNQLGSSNIMSDNNVYSPDAARIELGCHNIYNHEQQLILMAGAIAFAHAEELVETPLASA